MTRPESVRRRAFWVKHESHRRLILRICLILITLVMVSGIAFYILAEKRLSDEFYRAHSQIRTTMEMLLPWMIIVYVLGICFTFSLTAIYTRRLAGPVLKFNRELEQLAGGDYTTQIKLRRGDEFQDIASKINDSASHTAQKFRQITELQERVQKLAERLQYLELDGGTNRTTEREELLKDLQETSEQLKSILSEIRF